MIDTDEYLGWDATAMAELVRAGEVHPDDLEACARELIERLQPRLNCVAEVREPEAEPATGGAFAGVPFLVKELLAYPGLAWTMGSRLLAANPPGDPSPYAERLRAAGLRVIASTTSSEFGLLGSTESALRGVTRNPWDPELSAGGSSGGSAAAVAAGIVPMAHANDAGGSIRFPAAMTGSFGFTPSNGRCEPTGPPAGGLADLVVDHCVSRTVRDSARLLAATERRGAHRRFDPIGEVSGPGPRRPTIGVVTTTLLGDTPDPEVLGAIDRTREQLDELGHHVVDVADLGVDGPGLSEAFFTTAAVTMATVAGAVEPLLGRPPGPDELEPFTLELVEWATHLPPDAADRAAGVLRAQATAYLQVFETCDVVLSPTVTRPPWELGTLAPDLGRDTLIERTGALIGYTPIHNAAGTPAMSVPLHHSGTLPIGVHFAAAPGDDRTLLELAHLLEAAHPWSHRRPPTFGG